MKSWNEQVFLTEYMRMMECSEAQARSVYIIMDALVVSDGAEGLVTRESRHTDELVSPE
jgi:hypothetical protein